MMRIGIGAAILAVILATPLLADDWNPTPMVIDAEDVIEYAFDGTEVEIPFDLTGKAGKLWLVIESRLPDEAKPVAVMNGFKGWHFVNGIDTTIYVSTAREYAIGSGHVFPWDGHGNEIGAGDALNLLGDSGQVPLGTYTYYLWGYDHLSNRELACDFLAIGSYWEGQYQRFYVHDDQGALYDTPMLMGTEMQSQTYSTDRLGFGDIFKWKLGNDPYNEGLLEVSTVAGFDPNEVYMHPDYDPERPHAYYYMVGYGAGIFDPRDHDVFYFAKNRYWEKDQTVVKYQYVSGGEAIQDTSWGDYNHISWPHPGNHGDVSLRSVLYSIDEDNLMMLDPGMNILDYQHDRLHVFPIDNPAQEIFNIKLEEFYMPEQPLDPNSQATRTSSEINRLFPGKRDGTFFITGDYTCLQELIDVSRLVDESGNLDPYSPDGSGYVVWANSNGDFFFDMSPYLDPENPSQHWACIVSDPRDNNNPREELQPADMNGFLVSFSEFTGLNTFGVYCPDGTGIDLASFGDTKFSAGGDNRQKRGGGEILDYGGQFDGLYTLMPIPPPGSVFYMIDYLKTFWIAFDSDSGIITNEPAGITNTDTSPAAFSVAQNSPNPFNPSTSIPFTLPEAGQVTVDIYNIGGQNVETLLDEFMTAGSHSVVWDASGYSAGVYFYRVTSGGHSETMKMTLVK